MGFTSAALVAGKSDVLVSAIKEGIKATGADPAKLAAIEIYDANKIAEWSCRHFTCSKESNQWVCGKTNSRACMKNRTVRAAEAFF